VINLYMAVTADRYELPLFVADSPRELVLVTGYSKNIILSSIAHNQSGRMRGVKFIRISVDGRGIEGD